MRVTVGTVVGLVAASRTRDEILREHPYLEAGLLRHPPTGRNPTIDGETMRLAVAATFTRRGIEIPNERPLALTSEFADDAQKKIQWAAFVRRARRPDLADLSAIIATLDRFLWPVLQAAARGEPWPRVSSNDGAWKEP